MLTDLTSALRSTIRRSPVAWALACGIHLRPYQILVANAIKDSVLHQRGLTFVVILPRQSGKNELQAHIFAWLLFRYARTGGRIVSVSPTFKPQTELSMVRVAWALDNCVGTRHLWKSSKGYVYQFGQARLQFFSGGARANVLGATADLLMSVDEAQSISASKFDKDFDPMTASTNATRVFYGIPWTSDNLLERERRIALQAQEKDGIQRLFQFTAASSRPTVCMLIASSPSMAATIRVSAPNTSAKPSTPNPACSPPPVLPSFTQIKFPLLRFLPTILLPSPNPQDWERGRG